MNRGKYAEFSCTFRQLEADQIRPAIALYSGAWTGEYNVKEIKRPSFVYNVYLLETGQEGMGHTIHNEELGLSACDIIVVSGTKKPVENPSMRLECGDR